MTTMPPPSWWAVDFLTGQRMWRIPTTQVGTVQRLIGEDRSTTVNVRVADNGRPIPGWDEGTAPGRVLLVAVDADDRILWAGLVRRRTSGLGPTADVSCDTLEKYLGRRYIDAVLTWADEDPAKIAADTLATITDLPPLSVTWSPTATKVVDGFYDTSDNKTVRSVLDDLAALDGGIEWTVEVEWADADHQQAAYRVVIAPRLGSSDADTRWVHQPGVGGCITDATYIEDFGDETGANDTLALSSGEGDSQPRSTRYVADELLSDGWARFERRFTPATSITSTTTLDAYAAADHAQTRLGLSQLSIVAHIDAAPRLNLDWWLGDTIAVSITSERWPAVQDADGVWQPGYSAELRVVGWTLDLDARTLTPLTKAGV